MSFHALHCHAASKPPAGLVVAAEVGRLATGGLRLHYRIFGIDALRIPALRPAMPVDGLWRHTCCEAFVAGDTDSSYHEFNFSPSGCWAAYRFTDTRQRDENWQIPQPLRVDRMDDGRMLHLVVELPAGVLPPDATRIGLTMVAEHADGELSYWALRHTAERPDFHLRDSFMLPLP
ncbi:MAG: DOMON-like domain-containing protein [Azonexaceae bacterium]|nr:DOMON-like domain-containing protein [Azonexaceae bacterium]